MTAFQPFGPQDAARELAAPEPGDDKYSRGVLGVVTGSIQFPGAAVLGVEAALRTGVGMVRYLGAAAELVLRRRPEAVTMPGRVQAWLLGSGIDSASRDRDTDALLRSALAEGLPVVLDSGALDLVGLAADPAAVVITPHYRELAAVLAVHGASVDAGQIAADPARWSAEAAERLGVTVLLKGSVTMVAGCDGSRRTVGPTTAWLASAGTGDVLGGVLGALIASRADDVKADASLGPRLAAAAAVIHAETAHRLSRGGPLVALDLAEALSATVAAMLRERA